METGRRGVMAMLGVAMLWPAMAKAEAPPAGFAIDWQGGPQTPRWSPRSPRRSRW
ncbi:hypothetical protein PQ455_16625 [Sphingomonas naphthae]|uniref:Uncharacterized protein n=1 Tax=Sphingomonas naphthae TaxID=1813468 RepID=A0ABY7TJ30_9SPHN|nr:hypothetical protein [Sphingomonas naphthae]WCT73222.1 hypothetical protein PQ455_16625 [Sphingomonas naphthae]